MAAQRSQDGDLALVEAMRQHIRSHGPEYLKDPNITSVGIGLKKGEDGAEDTLTIQFTVRRKVGDAVGLEELGTERLPTSIEIAGVPIPTDVVQRDFRSAYLPVVREAVDERKQRMDPVRPGVSISNTKGTAGTLGMIVQDTETGRLCALSNWHVLHGGDGAIGDDVVQPGPFDDNDVSDNVCGQLVRSHLGPAGDCAISSIEGRGTAASVLELDVVPDAVVRVVLGDRLVKSGRTTGVTNGVVRRTDVMAAIDYPGRGDVAIGGFEIGPPEGADDQYEVSKGGDSGSVWLVEEGQGRASSNLAGLHFAGETGDNPDEHALACYAHAVFEKLGIELPAAGLEAVQAGWDPGFLAERLDPPGLGRHEADAFVFEGSTLIPYTHFSVCMSTARRFPRFVAWNIDGDRLRTLARGDWFDLDDRFPEVQHGEELYADNDLDRGHIARRADLCWGPLAEARRANRESFLFTNIVPQHERFNQSRLRGLWGGLEDAIFEDVEVADLRISVFGGPILSRTDPLYREVRIPREFWKLIAYQDTADDAFKVRAYMLTQRDLLTDLEVLELDPFQVFQISVDELSRRTGLDFDGFAAFDTFGDGAGPEALAGTPSARLVAERDAVVA